jgi:hypothetical protein
VVDERDFYHRQTTNIYTLTRYAKCLLIVFSNVRLPSVKGKRVGHRITNPTRMKHQPLIVSRQQCLLHWNLPLANCIRRQIGCLHFGFYSLFIVYTYILPGRPLACRDGAKILRQERLASLLPPQIFTRDIGGKPGWGAGGGGCSSPSAPPAASSSWIMSCASCSFNLS